LGIGEVVVAGQGFPGGRVHDGVLDHAAEPMTEALRNLKGLERDVCPRSFLA
jgi:hypothetical protein